MERDTRGQKLLEIITHGLDLYANRNTQTQLKNREKYIGMSARKLHGLSPYGRSK